MKRLSGLLSPFVSLPAFAIIACFVILIFLATSARAQANYALQFNGTNQYVTFGAAPGLGASNFTLELWFMRTGTGITTTTGTGGITDIIPLISKGRGEADAGDNRDMNYILGIQASTNKLAADFEEGPAPNPSPSLNHPIVGSTVIQLNRWYHVAVTYNGRTWQLYVNGVLDGTLDLGAAITPRSDSIQHAALASALTSTGAAAGYFAGVLDEARIWNYARGQAEIQATMTQELTGPVTGLIGRWGMNEGSGTTASDSSGQNITGTLMPTTGRPTWATGYFDKTPPANPTGLNAEAGDRLIALKWNPNTESDLKGYNIFRSFTSPVPVTGTPLNGGAPFALPYFTDTGLANEQPYFYAITAVDTFGNFSGASAETSAAATAANGVGLRLHGSNAYVTFGNAGSATKLGLPTFTLEANIRRNGTGAGTSTGTGGLTSAVPLVAKGRAETDGSNVDMNYFLGIDTASNVLAADFEEGIGGTTLGLNHPVYGTTVIQNGVWYHVAATYDGTKWQLFVNGVLDKELTVGQPPRSDSIQHASIGSALTSTGAAAGFFDGDFDEVRIWNRALSTDEIRSNLNQQITVASGLVARWGLNEGSGAAVADSAPDPVPGAIMGTAFNWVPGAPAINLAPQVNAGADFAINLPAEGALSGVVSDDGLPPNSTLTIAWTQVSGPGTVSFGNPASPTSTAAFSAVGTYVLRLTASDGELTTSDDVQVTVNPPVNHAPEVEAGPDQTITLPNGATLAGSVSDDGLPAPPALTTMWSMQSGPGTVTFGNANSPSTTATFSQAGSYILLLTASDGELTGQDTVHITVNSPANRTPTVDAGLDLTITIPAAAALSGTASDDGLPNPPGKITALWTKDSGPGTVTFQDATSLATSASFSLPGTYVLRLSVSDSELANSDTATITVNAPINSPPVVEAGPDQTIVLPATAILVGSVIDDGYPLPTSMVITWSKLKGPGTVTFADPTSANTTATFGSAGSYELQLTANDGAAATTDKLNVTVNTDGKQSNTAVSLGAGSAYIRLGADSANHLNTSQFTLELWFLREGAGVGTTTGTGGIPDAIPLIAKGTAEAENRDVDFNYFLGIRASDGVLIADFEEATTGLPGNTPGLNHPVVGRTLIQSGLWHHAAATYDGNKWALYLDGTLETELVVGQPPNFDTTDPASIGTSLKSTGTPAGYFDGTVDEVRIWKRARTADEIAGGMLVEILQDTDLLGRWGMNEGSGDTVADSTDLPITGNLVGTGYRWVPGAPLGFNPNQAPQVDAGTDQAITLPDSASLAGSVIDDGLPGFPMALTWSKVSGPGTVTFSSPNSLATTATFSDPGAYVLRLTAFDGARAGSDTVAVGVNQPIPVNHPPTANPDLATTTHDVAVTINVLANDTDPDGDALQIASFTQPSHGSAAINGASIVYTPATAYAGADSFTYTAKDPSNAESNSATVNITVTAEANYGLSFTGTNAYVTFGEPAKLHLPTFTLETWFNWTGSGATTTTGTSGIASAIPLVTKGRHETDGSNVDMNFFLGIDATAKKLAADFEDMASGLNHPVVGVTDIVTNQWHHAAATYDGTTWRLYLDGRLESTLAVNQSPRSDSIQHAAVASALDSTGLAEGFFAGVIDEVRIWNRALSVSEIQANMNVPLKSGNGLIARWGMNEGVNTTVGDSIVTAVNGAIMGSGWSWTDGAPFNLTINHPPDIPVLVAPADGAQDVQSPVPLRVTASDPDGGNLNVTFYGRPTSGGTGETFSIAVLPDTQFYSATLNGGTPAMFNAQTNWIVNNRVANNIVYVAHEGDIVNTETIDQEWTNASNAIALLEDPVLTGLPQGIPFGLAVGNHDQNPNGDPNGSTSHYNNLFGVAHFSGRSYYGGHYGSDGDNHYDLFTASGMDFIVVYLEYGASANAAVLTWANDLLHTYSNRRAIVVNHDLIGTGNPGAFSSEGQAIYNALRGNTNLFLMLNGHTSGEGRRSDVYSNNTVNTLLADYQSRTNGGDGWMRILEFNPSSGQVHVKTFSPVLNQYETDADSDFTFDYSMQGGSFAQVGTATVASGSETSVSWTGQLPGIEYEWYAAVSDGVSTTLGPTWKFTTYDTPNAPPVAGNQSVSLAEDTQVEIALQGSDPDGNPITFRVVTAPAHGTLSGVAPDLTYTPTANYFGSDSFTFRVNDGRKDSNIATVSITITPVNDPPAAFGQSVITNADVPVSLVLRGSDPDMDPLTYAVVALPAHGTLSGTAPNLVYTPALHYTGSDSFTFKVNDGHVDSNVAAVSLLVNTALAVDATAFGDQPGSTTVQSAAFSTKAGNELLLAFIASDGATATTTVTSVTGASLTWTMVARANQQMGTAEIWRAFAPNALTNASVTATLSASVASSISVVTFTGADTGNSGAAAIGAVATANSATGAPSASLTTTRNGSWVFGVGVDWDRAVARTLGPNQTSIHQYMPPVGDTYWVQRQNAITPAAGTLVTINDTAPANDRFNLAICEVRAATAVPSNAALDFTGSGTYVTFGPAAQLGTATFTVEAWFKRDGPGTGTNTGSGGIADAIPIVTKGRSQSNDGDNRDMNYFLGIRASDGVLIADFEEGATGVTPGQNHPVAGVTPIPAGSGWNHAAATYDGTTWKLYLNGGLEQTLVVGQPPRSDSIQHAAIAAALDSTGAALGAFEGVIDEARIWNRARTAAEINDGMTHEIASDPSLLGRWGLNEGTGTAINDSSGHSVNGNVVGSGYAWVAGTPFTSSTNHKPDLPVLISPANNATGVSTPAVLQAQVSDPDGDPMTVTFFGRTVGAGSPFTLVVLPDTQFYSQSYPSTFTAQTQWIVNNRDALNTVFVTHMGDITNDGDSNEQEWKNASASMAVLDAANIPYNVTTGNHDESTAGVAAFFDSYFPTTRYAGKPWYGGYLAGHGDKNNYELITAGGVDLLFVALEYDSPGYAVTWADSILKAYPNRKAILTTHVYLNAADASRNTAPYNRPDGTASETLWRNLISTNCNVILVLSGHDHGENHRVDLNTCGQPVHQIVQDYQDRANGGDGWLRYYQFNPATDTIETYTYSPTLDQFETDANSRFTLQGWSFAQLKQVANVASGTSVNATWTGSQPGAPYDWYVVASDGKLSNTSAMWRFTTGIANRPPVAANDSYNGVEDSILSVSAPGVLANDSDPDGDPLSWTVVASPAHGALVPAANGSFTYTPAANYNGPDSFTYQIQDGKGSTASATVTLTIAAVNDAPVAADRSVSTTRDTSTAVTLAATDVDGDALTYTVVASPTHGTLSGTAPNLTYAPTTGYTGADSFTFKANDSKVDSNVATVSITVVATNRNPVAVNDSYNAVEDTVLGVSAPGVLANDSDPDGDPLTWTVTINPAHGALVPAANGSFTYTPAANYNGTDSFTYQLQDGKGGSSTATVTINVAAVNDPPVAAPQSITTNQNTAAAVRLAATDVDGDALTYTVVVSPAHGTLTGTAPNLTYTPAAGYFGSDSFTFKANDGKADSNVATVSITVNQGVPPSPAPAIDAVAFGDQAGNTTVQSAAFSTTGGNELLLAFIASDGTSSITTVNSVTGAGLTWTMVVRANQQMGTAEIWRAFAPSTLTNVTVTATLSARVASSITVVSFSGVDTGSAGANAIGATAGISKASGAPSASLTTTRNNSWVLGVGADWDKATARTLGPGQSMIHQYMPSVGDTYWVQRQSNPTAASGSTVTINDTAPTADRSNLAIVEVRGPSAGDTLPPTVSMTAPANGAFVRGSVVVSANASDDVAVTGVQFLLDGNGYDLEDTTSPYSVTWNTVGLADGTHTLAARARDTVNHQTTSTSVTVTVDNTAPTAAVTSPSPGSTVTGTITLAANATDNFSVAGVTFRVDGVAFGAEDTVPPYSMTWDSKSVANGSHVLTAVARDAAGSQTTSAGVTVNVDNGTPAPGLAIDTVVSGDQGTLRNTAVTPAFSTHYGNELLLALISSDAIGSTVQVNSIAGAGLTWTPVVRANAQLGTAEIWRAFAPAALSNITVTATLSQTVASSITVMSFTGVDTGNNGANAVGHFTANSAAAGAPTASLVTTRAKVWVVGVGTDWDNPTSRTAGPNQIVVHQYMPPVGDTYWVQRQNAVTPLAGTTVIINDTAPAGDRFNVAICEVVPAP